MAIFDEIGKKISQAGQGAVSKTKNAADLVKINSAISEEEKKTNLLLNQVGRICYEQNKNNPSSEYAQVFEDIKQSIAKLAAMREQVKQIRGLKNCPNCGIEVPTEASFCTGCGQNIGGEKPASGSCTKCGAPMLPDAVFCTKCGQKKM